ncbi:MAG: hypothetical protein WEF50_16310 [Myxococcota bacterium]
MKGSTLLGAVKFLRSKRVEATALLPDEHRHYLDETIKNSAWYPLEDLLALVGAAADLLGTGRDQAFEFMGEFAARAHAEFYGDLLRGSGSSSRVFALWSTQFDAGQMHRIAEAPGRARVELQEFKSPSRELCLLIGGYIRGTLGLNDVEDIVVEKLSCTTQGQPVCAWRASWKRDDDD